MRWIIQWKCLLHRQQGTKRKGESLGPIKNENEHVSWQSIS